MTSAMPVATAPLCSPPETAAGFGGAPVVKFSGIAFAFLGMTSLQINRVQIENHAPA